MTFRLPLKQSRGFAVAIAVGICLIATQASGQTTAQSPAQSGQSIRTGDGMLAIEANLPEQVRIGEQFTYDVTVQNATDNVTLHDIELRHADQSSLTIESIAQQDQGDQKKLATDNQDAAAKSSQQNSDNKRPSDEPQSRFANPANQRQSADGFDGNSSSDQALTIQALQPGESQTFHVTASVDQEGPVKACLMITHYRPSICLQTTAIKPELKITKQSPQRNQLCEVIELVYTVTNDGTGAVGKFEIRDDLSDGLRTIDDQETLAFAVDQLKGGDTRKFVARVYATKTGEFRSRAYAKAVDSDLSARSENVGPEIVGAQLQVDVQGRNAVPSETPAVFTATVRNTGQAVAENIQVAVHIPENANLHRISDVQLRQRDPSQLATDRQSGQTRRSQYRGQVQESSDQPASQPNAEQSAVERLTRGRRSAQQSQAQPKQTAGNASTKSGNAADQKTETQAAMRAEEFSIESLEPGQSAQFDYVLTARNQDRIETMVIARSICNFDGNQDVAYDATSEDTATASTRIIRLPGLQVYTLDDADPAKVGSPITYTIRVKNEGEAPDQNIQITATLPEQLKLDNADGPTESQHEGSTITFQPIDQLNPGEEAEYTLTATVQSAGAAQLKVELVSQSFTSPVETSEPTQLFDPKGAATGQ